jgi:hypothetical protein
MKARLRLLPVAATTVCLAFAGSASAGTASYSGVVGNGSCDAARAVSVSGPSRIDVELSSTAQNPATVFAEVVAPSGKVVAGGSATAYDTPGGGSYSVRVCSEFQLQSPPQFQYSALIGTGPAGQSVLTGPAQPQPRTGSFGVLAAHARTGAVVTGKAAIRTRAGLAWFTVHTASNVTLTLRIFDPVHNTTRVVKGLTGTYTGKTLRITGHGLRLVIVNKAANHHVAFTSSSFKASGHVVRGGFTIIA